MNRAKAKSLSVAPPKIEQRDDRQQRDERRRERPRDRLPQRDVRDLPERAALHQRDVLPDPVEDDDRVVDRVPEHRQDRGDRRGRHLPPEQRVDPDRDQDVVDQRHDRGHGELPLEPHRDVADDQEQRDDDREDRALRDLAAEACRHVLDPERVGFDGLRQVRLELRRLVGRERLGPDLEALVVAVRRGAAALDDGAPLADAGGLRTHRLERRRRGRRERDLGAALEVDPEVEPADRRARESRQRPRWPRSRTRAAAG